MFDGLPSETPMESTIDMTYRERQVIEEGFKPTTWWRAVDAMGNMVAGSQNVEDFKALGLDKTTNVFFERLYEKTETVWASSDVGFTD